LKIKNKGCSVCGFWDEKILRFFHFDHINPKDKIDAISNMVNYNVYTLEDVIKESLKTRIICAHCHAIHTSNQKEMGIL